MRSHLTRCVFRRIIANEPVVRHYGLQTISRPQLYTTPRHRISPTTSSRTFLNWFRRARKNVRDSRIDPGVETMLGLDKRLNLIARLLPSNQLVDAVRAFTAHKTALGKPIEDFQASLLLQTLRTLEEHEDCLEEQRKHAEDKAEGWSLDPKLLRHILTALERRPAQDYTKVHSEVAKVTWRALESRLTEEELYARASRGMIQVLCSTGDSDIAKRIMEKIPRSAANRSTAKWSLVLAGYAREEKESEMLALLEQFKTLRLKSTHHVDKVMAVYYARKDKIEEAKRWFTLQALEKDTIPKEAMQEGTDEDGRGTTRMAKRQFQVVLVPSASEVYQELFQFCLRNAEMEWGNSLFQSMDKERASDARDETWKAVFVASAATGKSVDEIDRMVAVMSQRSAAESSPRQQGPSIHTLNCLIRFAVSKKDPYMAERYFSLATKWEVEPNAETYMLQVKYRLDANDLEGALAAYTKLRHGEVIDNEDWELTNELLIALLNWPKPIPHEVIMGLVSVLTDSRQVYDCETTKALCVYHLDRDEYFQVVDLLQMHAPQYSVAQRMEVYKVLCDYALDPDIDTARAWDTYMIFHQVFATETRREMRNKVMQLMFDRGRPDLATHVFMRMSSHERADTRPSAESYVIAFEGIAKTAERDALEVIHNLLKLDTEVDPDTRVQNGLMLAYIACGSPGRALSHWREIAESKEGPSYNSLHIALRACEGQPYGYRIAQRLWAKLMAADIEITRDLFVNYMACMSKQRQQKDVQNLLKDMKEVTGCDVDFFAIGSIFNAAFTFLQQDAYEVQFKEQYPKIWEQVVEAGLTEDERGMKHIPGIDRSLKA